MKERMSNFKQGNRKFCMGTGNYFFIFLNFAWFINGTLQNSDKFILRKIILLKKTSNLGVSMIFFLSIYLIRTILDKMGIDKFFFVNLFDMGKCKNFISFSKWVRLWVKIISYPFAL
jgi:hypothetical protein